MVLWSTYRDSIQVCVNTFSQSATDTQKLGRCAADQYVNVIFDECCANVDLMFVWSSNEILKV